MQTFLILLDFNLDQSEHEENLQKQILPKSNELERFIDLSIKQSSKQKRSNRIEIRRIFKPNSSSLFNVIYFLLSFNLYHFDCVRW